MKTYIMNAIQQYCESEGIKISNLNEVAEEVQEKVQELLDDTIPNVVSESGTIQEMEEDE